ncbi:hypothetical protein N657DRAFT_404318 [Parathielavia appendiculata]|uniref:Uncharacterized protein n=1 Tax=Parathielavia appendiculata TaxID=2587402 RepID=A0AAN6TPF4_9PEZI|nr:hypothetical protein N657DRAFT_404318 [Parathielavia appendiculata]
MQQPAYSDPRRVYSGPKSVSRADERINNDERDSMLRLRRLKQAYPETVNRSRTLDEYLHEFIDRDEPDFRNGERVVSRYLEGIRPDNPGIELQNTHSCFYGRQKKQGEEHAHLENGHTCEWWRRNSSSWSPGRLQGLVQYRQ